LSLEEKYYKISAVIIITALVIGAVMVALPYPLFSGAPAERTAFMIEKGESLGAVAHSLADQNLVMSRYLFVAYAIFTGQERKFQAGEYIIPPRVSIRGLVTTFAEGRGASEDITVTVPEGTNLADLGRILSKSGLPVKTEDFLGPDMLKLEGYLFPDTYRFQKSQILNPKSQTPKESELPTGQANSNGQNLEQQSIGEIIGKMRKNFEEKTADLFKNLGAEKIRRTIIIASILEKEVKNQRDMKLVAGIIERRLSKNMPLEIDATVTYGVCEPKFLAGKYCDVSMASIIDNIKVGTPYNTYANKGLPAGPISNPGLATIEAALNPEKSDYLYYLSAPDGTTIFSKTAAEHTRARAKYLENRK